MTSPRHIRLRRAFWISSGIVIAILIVVLTAKFWLVPAVAKKQINRRLTEFWDGPAAVEKIEFNYFTPTALKDITFHDNSQRNWLRIDSLKVTIGNWLSFSPKVKNLEIGKLEILAYLTNGRLALPLKPPSEKPDANLADYLDLQKVVIHDASIGLQDQRGSKISYDNLHFSAVRNLQTYEISLVQHPPQSLEKLSVTGSVDPNFKTNLLFETNQNFEKPETDIIFALLNVPHVYHAEGNLTADFTINGPLKDPAALRPKGIVSLDQWAVFVEDRLIAEKLNVRINANETSYIIERLEAIVCGGPLEGSFYADNKRPDPIEFGGQIAAEKIDLPLLAAALRSKKKVAEGLVTFRYHFSANEKDLQSMQGQGLILLNDTSMTALPVSPKIFRFIGLKGPDPLQTSDAAAIFTVSGPTVIIERARLAAVLGAIRAEPGGTVNLQTGNLDFYVVAVPLSQVEELLETLPVAQALVKLKSSLSRLHVKGHWSQPPAKLITKEPLEDIREATLVFLQGLVRTEGQFDDATYKRFRESFQTGE